MQMVKEAKLAATEVESYYPSITLHYLFQVHDYIYLWFIVPGSNYRRRRNRRRTWSERSQLVSGADGERLMAGRSYPEFFSGQGSAVWSVVRFRGRAVAYP